MSEIHYEIVSPKKLEQEATAHMVVIPSTEGDIGFLQDRMPIMLMLDAGVIYVMNAQQQVTDRIFTTGGYAQFEDNVLRVLCNESFNLDVISDAEIQAKIDQAQERCKAAHTEMEQEIEEISLHHYQKMKALKSAPAY